MTSTGKAAPDVTTDDATKDVVEIEIERPVPAPTPLAVVLRHTLYVALGAVGFASAWPYALDWAGSGGRLLDPGAFVGDAVDAGGTAAFLAINLTVALLVFAIWVVTDARRIGLGTRWGLGFAALACLGLSLGLAVYLVTRERYLSRRDALDADTAVVPGPTSAGEPVAGSPADVEVEDEIEDAVSSR